LRRVPGWDALDLPWREAEFCVVDLETTGLDLKRDDIVSYGAVLVREGRIIVGTSVYGLVRPRTALTERAITVHALTAADLASAPPLSQCAGQLAELLQGRVLVAHAAWVERAFIARALREGGVRLDGPVIDTAALARETRAAALGEDDSEPGLEPLAAALGLPVHTPHHALGDALTTAGVFLALVSRLDAREPQTVRSLAAMSNRQALR
jgi:DNA polymerase-3 subunit epsilon